MIVVKDSRGMVLYSGTEDEIADFLKIKYKEVRKALITGMSVKGAYKIEYEKEEHLPKTIREHLYDENGKRKYEHRKGFPNRYKDASCRRFTPL